MTATALLLCCCLLGAASAATPSVTLSNGVEMPLVAAGTWQYDNATATSSVKLALAAGFTHIDTAFDYGNQIGVKAGLAGVDRSKYFLTSKVPGCGLQGISVTNCKADTAKVFDGNLEALGVSAVDLMLLHFPPPTGCNALTCKGIQGQWEAFEEAYAAKKARAIGVSNYCISCFEKCLKGKMTVVPMVNQVQFHVGMGNDPEGLFSYAKAHNITMQAYSPLGDGKKELITGNMTTTIGKAHQKSGAQVALKWIVAQGIPLVTKANSASFLAEDIDLFSWELTAAEKSTLDAATSPAGTPSFMCKA